MVPEISDLGILPSDFLSQPSPHITKSTVDWSQTQLSQNGGCYAVILDNVMTKSECDQLTQAAVAHASGQWEPAMVRAGKSGEQRLYTDVRNNERIMWDSKGIVARLWKRIEEHVPEIHSLQNCASVTGNGPVMRGEVWEFTELNERMRFLQYGPGEYFKAHCDGAFERPDGSARTMYTLHLYLNERTEENQLLGGATSFHHRNMQPENDFDVYPRAGRVLIFQHRSLLHSGQEVEKGLKITMRTDLLFKKTKSTIPDGKRAKVTTDKSNKPPRRRYLVKSQGSVES